MMRPPMEMLSPRGTQLPVIDLSRVSANTNAHESIMGNSSGVQGESLSLGNA